jgi:hypothetical protein
MVRKVRYCCCAFQVESRRFRFINEYPAADDPKRLHSRLFSYACQKARSKIIPNPEACLLNHLIQYRLAFGYKTALLRFRQSAEQSHVFQASIRRDATAALFVDQNERRSQFKRHDDGFGFTGVELLTEFGELCAIPGGNDAHPAGLYVDSMPAEFLGHPRRQHNFAKKTPQKVQAADNR